MLIDIIMSANYAILLVLSFAMIANNSLTFLNVFLERSSGRRRDPPTDGDSLPQLLQDLGFHFFAVPDDVILPVVLGDHQLGFVRDFHFRPLWKLFYEPTYWSRETRLWTNECT